MLKKRILASSMASVMALSSVSVVAFAEEKKDYGEAVTAKELKEYTDNLEDFIADELPNYGSKQGEKFQAAYDHAIKVLDDEDSEAADYTAAYQMVKAVKAELQVYTDKQLQGLIDDNKSKYDKNNEFNEELQDNIYTESTYSDFTAAYDDAERYVDSEDSMLITDAYIALDDAVKKLEELNTVTKSQFRTALRNYEELEYKMKNYESWRRGTLTVKSTTGTAKAVGDIVSKKPAVTFGELQEMVYGVPTANFRYWDKTKWKDLEGTVVSDDDNDDHSGEGSWIGGYDIPNDEALKPYITARYKELDDVKGATITSKPEIVAAYEAAVDAVAVFNGWQVDSYKTGSKGSCANLLKKFRPQLVETFNGDDIEALIDAINYDDDASTGWFDDKDSDSTLDSGEKKYTLKHDPEDHTLKCNMALYILKNKDTGLWVTPTGASAVDDCIWKTKDEADTALNSETNKADMSVQKISAGTNILTYMKYEAPTAADVETAKQGLLDTFNGVVTGKAGDLIADADWATKKVQEKDGGESVKVEESVTGVADVTYKEIEKTTDNMADDGTNPDASHAGTTAIEAHNAAVTAIKSAYTTLTTGLTALENGGSEFGDAEALYETYKGYNFPDDADTALGVIGSYADGKTISKCSGSTTEWTLVWRNLAYVLDDMFPEVVEDDKTLSDLKKMIDRAYEAAEATGDSSLFADIHADVVDERQRAIDWYKEAKATTGYKTEEEVAGTTLAVVYKNLKDDVEKLEGWLKDFKYSYGEIKADIAKIADAIEKGDVKGDELTKALTKCAYDLSVLEASDIFEDDGINPAFDDERIFQAANRLKTGNSKAGDKIKPNDFEKNLKTSYEALLKAYNEAENPSTPAGEADVNGDGAVDFGDVEAVIDAMLTGSTDAKFDLTKDTVVDFSDVEKAIDNFLAAMA